MSALQHFKQEIMPMKDKLFRVALRITGDSSEAEDVVQEAFIKVWDLRQTWSNYNNLQGWVMSMTKNKAIDKTRSKHRRTTSLDGVYNMPKQENSPEQTAILSDELQRIQAFMKQLPEKQRLVMELRDFEELTYNEIAEQLDIPMNHVKVNLSRARKAIRNLLTNDERLHLYE
jgi:RNA polymerase sigma factor (sigma-70 family)